MCDKSTKELVRYFQDTDQHVIAIYIAVAIKRVINSDKSGQLIHHVDSVLAELIEGGLSITKPYVKNLLEFTKPPVGYVTEASIGEVLGIRNILDPKFLDRDTALIPDEVGVAIRKTFQEVMKEERGIE